MNETKSILGKLEALGLAKPGPAWEAPSPCNTLEPAVEPLMELILACQRNDAHAIKKHMLKAGADTLETKKLKEGALPYFPSINAFGIVTLLGKWKEARSFMKQGVPEDASTEDEQHFKWLQRAQQSHSSNILGGFLAAILAQDNEALDYFVQGRKDERERYKMGQPTLDAILEDCREAGSIKKLSDVTFFHILKKYPLQMQGEHPGDAGKFIMGLPAQQRRAFFEKYPKQSALIMEKLALPHLFSSYKDEKKLSIPVLNFIADFMGRPELTARMAKPFWVLLFEHHEGNGELLIKFNSIPECKEQAAEYYSRKGFHKSENWKNPYANLKNLSFLEKQGIDLGHARDHNNFLACHLKELNVYDLSRAGKAQEFMDIMELAILKYPHVFLAKSGKDDEAGTNLAKVQQLLNDFIEKPNQSQGLVEKMTTLKTRMEQAALMGGKVSPAKTEKKTLKL